MDHHSGTSDLGGVVTSVESEFFIRSVDKATLADTWFIFIDEILYRWFSMRPFFKCLGKQEAYYVLREIYEGSCGSHVGGSMLAEKKLLIGYFWPIMEKDAK